MEENLELNRAIEMRKAAEKSDKHIHNLICAKDSELEMCEINRDYSKDTRFRQ